MLNRNQDNDDSTMPSTVDTSSYVHDMNMDDTKLESEVLKLTVTPKHDSIGQKNPEKWTSACVTIQASDVPEEMVDKTSQLDISVALDISGSMSGTKLRDCKSTLETMIRSLGPKDRFALVTFGSYANVVVPNCLMTKENKEMALKKIKAVECSGCTNLSGGLCLAWQELLMIDSPNPVRSVFLLTDGQANEGVTETETLVKMVKSFNEGSVPRIDSSSSQDMRGSIRSKVSRLRVKSFGTKRSKEADNTQAEIQNEAKIPTTIALDDKGSPVSLFCFGYGSDHNSDMLRSISEVTPGGAYYFVEKDSDVSTAFGDAMGGLLSVMAQSAVLRLSVTPSAAAMGVKIRDVHHDDKVDRGDGSFTVSLGDFYAEESRDVIFDFDLSKEASETPVPHIQASLTYMNIINKTNTHASPVECCISRPETEDISPANKYVESQLIRLYTIQEIQAADLLAQQNQLEAAKERLTSAATRIKGSEAYTLDDCLLQSLEANVDEVMMNYGSKASYTSVGNHQSKNITQTLKKQRGMVSSSASTTAYQTRHKMKMAKDYSNSNTADRKSVV